MATLGIGASTTLVGAALAAALAPSEAEATSWTLIREPTSAVVSAYTCPVAPEIRTQLVAARLQRSHW